MSSTETVNPADIICGLKAAVTALECYHHMDLLKQAQEIKRAKPSPPPMFMMIPIEEKTNGNKRSRDKCENNVLIEVPTKSVQPRVEDKGHANHKSKEDCSQLALNLKFPEMRGGILFTRCYCVHRDGLQDSCPLTACLGHQADCNTKPWPTCPPAKFLRCRFPQQFTTENSH
ncbi:uncharacterized protein LOC117220124 [Megalopta genalis]|uniref:uncharacterized protein LOC117220124 n=1 Tax=Megalopta genalis TaxID=115081 RepID=UPI001443744D|nr:uncharacterized protein LOC117220124 [Megalopta genalis]